MPGARVRPLLLRPGARFACARGGMCCSDMHLLGPLEQDEAERIRRSRPDAVRVEPLKKRLALVVGEDHRCVLLDPDGCSLHVEGGARAKPDVCRRFPYALIATAMGGRVATAHRCPCRTLGDRPPLSITDVESSLAERDGELVPSAIAPDRIPLTARATASIATYAAAEERVLDALLRGVAPAHALGVAPGLPRLRSSSWGQVAGRFLELGAHPSFAGHALTWFGHGLLAVVGDPARRELQPRPWRQVFDAAEREARVIETPEKVIGDHLADHLWCLAWIAWGPFDRARVCAAVLGAVAGALTDVLVREGARPDRAAAEAVMITELAAAHPAWGEVAVSVVPQAQRHDGA